MVSKTSLLEAVKGFDWKVIDAGLKERPDLLGHREEREKNWLHVLCSTKLKGRRPAASIKTADVLLARGIDLHAHAFTEGSWKATPVWWCVAWGRNLGLAEHLLKLGATADYSMFAACWNDDVPALELLLKYGALVDDLTSGRETPFLGAIAWSRFRYAKALLNRGADVNARNENGLTALHLMLKKGADFEHFAMLSNQGPRGDIPGPDGKTAIEIMSRKKDERFRKLARKLGGGPASRGAGAGFGQRTTCITTPTRCWGPLPWQTLGDVGMAHEV